MRDWLQRELLPPSELIAPVLVQPADRDRRQHPNLPTAVAIGELDQAAQDLWALGVRAVKLFCYVTDKHPDGSAATDPSNLMVAAIQEVRSAVPDMVISTEVCGCAWTSSGECVLAAR